MQPYFHKLTALLVSAALVSSTAFPPVVWGSLQDRAVRDGTSPTRPAGVSTEAPPSLDLAQLDLSSLTIPQHLGFVMETYTPPGQVPKALVIHLQDLHTHPTAQTHLSELLGYLHDRLGIHLVALEGAEGLCDTTIYSDFPDPPSTEKIARLFLKEGLFTGAEYYAITHPGTVRLWGAEDESLYLEHLAIYQQGATRRAEAEAMLTQLRHALTPFKTRLYPKPLHQLLKLREAYEQGSEGDGAFSAYFTELWRLAQHARLELARYPHVEAMAKALELREQLDMRQVEAESQQLLETLWPQLTGQERTHLNQLAKALTATQIPALAYYETLDHTAKAHDVLRPRAFRRYLHYERLSQKTQSHAFAEEFDTLEEVVEQALLSTEQQRTLAKLLKLIDLMDGLIHVKLSPRHYRAYQQHRAALTPEALLAALRTLTTALPLAPSQLERLIEALPTHERFYDLAITRDEALVRHTIEQLQHEPAHTAVLIAGGFHTPGLTARLKEQAIAYAVITPKVEGEFNESQYQGLLSSQFPDLDTLWGGVQTMLLPGVLAEKAPVTLNVPVEGAQKPASGRSEQQEPVRFSSRDAKVLLFFALGLGLLVAAGMQAPEAWEAIVQAVPRITDYVQLSSEGGQLIWQAVAAPVVMRITTDGPQLASRQPGVPSVTPTAVAQALTTVTSPGPARPAQAAKAKVWIPTPLRRYTANHASVEVPATTVAEALKQLTTQYPDLKDYLYTHEGNVNRFLRVYLSDGEDVTEHLAHELAFSDELQLVSAIAGGSDAEPPKKRTPPIDPSLYSPSWNGVRKLLRDVSGGKYGIRFTTSSAETPLRIMVDPQLPRHTIYVSKQLSPTAGLQAMIPALLEYQGDDPSRSIFLQHPRINNWPQLLQVLTRWNALQNQPVTTIDIADAAMEKLRRSAEYNFLEGTITDVQDPSRILGRWRIRSMSEQEVQPVPDHGFWTGFQMIFQGRPVHVRGLHPEYRRVSTLVNALKVRTEDGRYVLPRVLRIYAPYSEITKRTVSLNWRFHGLLGESETHILRYGRPLPSMFSLEGGRDQSLFKFIPLRPHEFEQAARELGTEKTLFEQAEESAYVIVVSEWIPGPNTERFLHEHTDRPDLLWTVGRYLREALDSLHANDIVAGDTHLGQFVVQLEGERIQNVVRIDLENMYTYDFSTNLGLREHSAERWSLQRELQHWPAALDGFQGRPPPAPEGPAAPGAEDSRGYSGLDNTIYTPAIRAKLDAGEFFTVQVQGGRFVPTTILHEETGQAIGRQVSDGQLRLLNALAVEPTDLQVAEGARVFFIDGLDAAVEAVLEAQGARAPPEGCFGSHYGQSRHQYYLNSRHLNAYDRAIIPTHLHHEIQERTAVLSGEPPAAAHVRLKQEVTLFDLAFSEPPGRPQERRAWDVSHEAAIRELVEAANSSQIILQRLITIGLQDPHYRTWESHRVVARILAAMNPQAKRMAAELLAGYLQPRATGKVLGLLRVVMDESVSDTVAQALRVHFPRWLEDLHWTERSQVRVAERIRRALGRERAAQWFLEHMALLGSDDADVVRDAEVVFDSRYGWHDNFTSMVARQQPAVLNQASTGFIRALALKNKEARRAAVYAMRKVGAEAAPALPKLLEIWRKDPSPPIRKTAHETLTRLNSVIVSSRVVPDLAAAVQSPNPKALDNALAFWKMVQEAFGADASALPQDLSKEIAALGQTRQQLELLIQQVANLAYAAEHDPPLIEGFTALWQRALELQATTRSAVRKYGRHPNPGVRQEIDGLKNETKELSSRIRNQLRALKELPAAVLRDDVDHRTIDQLLGRQPAPHWLQVIAKAIQAGIPPSTASFVPEDAVASWLGEVLEAGDLRGHVPAVLRGREFGGGQESTIVPTKWSLKSDETIDPDGQLQQWLGLLQGVDIQDAWGAELNLRAALRDYLRGEGERTAMEMTLLSTLFAYAGHNQVVQVKARQIQLDSVEGLRLFEELFVNRANVLDAVQSVVEEVVGEVQARLETPGTTIANPTALAKAVEGVWQARRLSQEEKEARLADLLSRSTPEAIQGQLLPLLKDERLKTTVSELATTNPASRARQVHQVIRTLFRQPLERIRQEQAKWAYVEQPHLKKELAFRVVKGIPYGLWGANAGVCIARDLDLWKSPHFFLLAIIERSHNQVVGFVHLYEQTINGKRLLTVPGVEPSVEFLSELKGRELYPLLERTLMQVAEQGGYDALVMPSDPNILSNRADILTEVRKKSYAPRQLHRSISWSHAPSYPFSMVYLIWNRPGVNADDFSTDIAEGIQQEIQDVEEPEFGLQLLLVPLMIPLQNQLLLGLGLQRHFELMKLMDGRPFARGPLRAANLEEEAAVIHAAAKTVRQEAGQPVAIPAEVLTRAGLPAELAVSAYLDPAFHAFRSDAELLALLARALAREKQANPQLGLTALNGRPLTLILADEYTHLAGNHIGDGIIILHRRNFTDPKQAFPDDPATADTVTDALIAAEFAHELGAHELPGRGTEADQDLTRQRHDLANLATFVGAQLDALATFLGQPGRLAQPITREQLDAARPSRSTRRTIKDAWGRRLPPVLAHPTTSTLVRRMLDKTGGVLTSNLTSNEYAKGIVTVLLTDGLSVTGAHRAVAKSGGHSLQLLFDVSQLVQAGAEIKRVRVGQRISRDLPRYSVFYPLPSLEARAGLPLTFLTQESKRAVVEALTQEAHEAGQPLTDTQREQLAIALGVTPEQVRAWAMATPGPAPAAAQPPAPSLTTQTDATRAQALEASREILHSVATHGLLPPRELSVRGLPSSSSYDGARTSWQKSASIAINVIAPAGTLEANRQQAERVIYDYHAGAVSVLIERADDVLTEPTLWIDAELSQMMSERAQWSVVALLDPARLDGTDQRYVQAMMQRLISSRWLELSLKHPAAVSAIHTLLVPQHLADAARAVFPTIRIVPVSGTTHTVSVKRLISDRIGNLDDVQDDGQPRDVDIAVPDYVSGLAAYLHQHQSEKYVVLHAIRLVAPSDLSAIHLPVVLQPRAEDRAPIIVARGTLGQMMEELVRRQPELARALFTDHERHRPEQLKPSVHLLIGGQDVADSYPRPGQWRQATVKPGASVVIVLEPAPPGEDLEGAPPGAPVSPPTSPPQPRVSGTSDTESRGEGTEGDGLMAMDIEDPGERWERIGKAVRAADLIHRTP